MARVNRGSCNILSRSSPQLAWYKTHGKRKMNKIRNAKENTKNNIYEKNISNWTTFRIKITTSIFFFSFFSLFSFLS